jgi:hypothetical protein
VRQLPFNLCLNQWAAAMWQLMLTHAVHPSAIVDVDVKPATVLLGVCLAGMGAAAATRAAASAVPSAPAAARSEGPEREDALQIKSAVRIHAEVKLAS